MKVLFSNPPWWEGQEGQPPNCQWRGGVRAGSRWPWTGLLRSEPDRFRFGDYMPYPFFMGYATTYAREKTGADVRFRDSIALRESYDRYFEHLQYERYDYVFIESATPSWANDSRLIRAIVAACPETRIVVTGPITSTKGEEILAQYPVWACIRGEYEKGSVRVINGESGLLDHDRLSEAEMNAAPFPYYDDTYAKRYWDNTPVGQQRPQAQVWSSRGCPYKCIFCVWPATMTGNDPDGTGTRTVRHYSPDYMEAFLTELVERFNYRCIYFDDDTFNLGNRHVLGMCEVMSRIGLPWSAMCRADTIKMDTWRAMKESGCFGVKLGFESGNQWVVDNIVKKNLDLERAREVVYELKRLGMTVHGTFTFGLPGETREQMLDTKRYIESLPFDTFQASGTALIEGTPLHTLAERGRLDKYAGARIDESFDAEADGSKKMAGLAAALRET
jgi:radical SAM superfamily enzyme YgiQ (UPF0313 family)